MGVMEEKLRGLAGRLTYRANGTTDKEAAADLLCAASIYRELASAIDRGDALATDLDTVTALMSKAGQHLEASGGAREDTALDAALIAGEAAEIR